MQSESISGEKSQTFVSYINDFRLFSTVYHFFSSLRQITEQLDDEPDFDLAGLERDILNCSASGELDEREIDIVARLSMLREALERFDAELPVTTLRHHFEQLGVPDANTLEMLLSFYLSKSVKIEMDRNKIDLISTWWGRLVLQSRNSDPHYTSSGSFLRRRLEKIYRNIGLVPMPASEIRDTLEILRLESKRLLTIRSLRELIDKQILGRMRKLKSNLGDLLFQPAVLSEVINLNICLHSAFRTLFAAEQSRFSAFPALPGEMPPGGAEPEKSVKQTTPLPPPKVSSPDAETAAGAATGQLNGTNNGAAMKTAEATEEQLLAVTSPGLSQRVDAAGAEILTRQLSQDSKPSATVTLDRAELLKVLQSIRTVILILDQQLQPLIDKIQNQ